MHLLKFQFFVTADFASEIADHTLEQMPNALYQGKRKVRRKTLPRQQQNGGDDSTDSEELDHSDSGYSSPMHRQNQISSGTDARSKTQESGSEKAPPASASSAVTQANSCAVRQANNTYHTATHYNEHEPTANIHQNTMSYASAVVSKQAALTPAHSQTTSAHNHIAQLNDGAISEQEETADDPTSGKKKKRKRGRRRKRKGLLDDVVTL